MASKDATLRSIAEAGVFLPRPCLVRSAPAHHWQDVAVVSQAASCTATALSRPELSVRGAIILIENRRIRELYEM